MSKLIIRRARLGHCKRGPEVCAKCREMDIEKICLMDIDPPDKGLIQRRVMEVEQDGEKIWCEYDILRSFSDEELALTYANEHHITDYLI